MSNKTHEQIDKVLEIQKHIDQRIEDVNNLKEEIAQLEKERTQIYNDIYIEAIKNIENASIKAKMKNWWKDVTNTASIWMSGD